MKQLSKVQAVSTSSIFGSKKDLTRSRHIFRLSELKEGRGTVSTPELTVEPRAKYVTKAAQA